MDYKTIINNMRNNLNIHGKRPAIVKGFNEGGIYLGKTRYFVISLKQDAFYFQGLKRLFNEYDAKNDFEIAFNKIKNIELYHESLCDTIVIYTNDKRYFKCIYFNNAKGMYENKVSIDYQLKFLKQNGIKVGGLNGWKEN